MGPSSGARRSRHCVFVVGGPDVRLLREGYGLSQAKFASLMGISVATLRNWEQGRRSPEGSARVLLRVVAKHPEAVLDVVAHGPSPTPGHREAAPLAVELPARG